MRRAAILFSTLITAVMPGLTRPARAIDFESRPVETRELMTPYIPFLNPVPERAELLGPGAARLTVSISNTNSWAGTDKFRNLDPPAPGVRVPIDQNLIDTYLLSNPGEDLWLVDGEVLWSDLIFRIGVHERLELGFDLPLIRYSGGFLDATIEEFHKTIGFSNDGRTTFNRNDFNLIMYLGSADLFVDGVPDRTGFGDLTLTARVLLWEDRATGRFVSAAGYLKLPTGDEENLRGSGSVDFGAQVFFTHQWKRQAYHLDGGLGILGDWKFVPDIPTDDILFGSGTYEWLMWRNWSVLAQVGFTLSPFRRATNEDLEKPSVRANLGFRWYFRSGLSIDALIEENLLFTNASADFGLHVGVSYRFGKSSPDGSG
jgi:hypothetical protein